MKSEQIQVQGEYEVNVESEPVIITEASTPDRHDTQMAEDEFEKDYDPDEEDDE